MGYTLYTRHKLVTIICVIGFLLVLFSMPTVFSPDTRSMGDFYPALFGMLIAFRFIAYVGLWHYKRWGVELFMYTVFANVVIGILTDTHNVIGTVYHVAILITLAFFYRKMDRNL